MVHEELKVDSPTQETNSTSLSMLKMTKSESKKKKKKKKKSGKTVEEVAHTKYLLSGSGVGWGVEGLGRGRGWNPRTMEPVCFLGQRLPSIKEANSYL